MLLDNSEESQTTAKILNKVTLGKPLKKDYQVQITSYSRRESKTHHNNETIYQTT